MSHSFLINHPTMTSPATIVTKTHAARVTARLTLSTATRCFSRSRAFAFDGTRLNASNMCSPVMTHCYDGRVTCVCAGIVPWNVPMHIAGVRDDECGAKALRSYRSVDDADDCRCNVVNAPEWIRTTGLILRRDALYPAELRARIGKR